MLKLQQVFRTRQYVGGIFFRQQSTMSPKKEFKESHLNKENFADLLNRRQSEAFRSVMLEVNAKDVCGQVYNYCKQFGEINKAYVYTLKEEQNLMLIEYDDLDAVNETFKFSGFKTNAVQWPNRFLRVRNSKLNLSLSKDAPLQIENAVTTSIAQILRNASTFDEQVDLLYRHYRLTDLSVRLKFLTALQAQIAINEYLDDIFPNAKVYPFGSSVNGFGKIGCDLDMVLHFDKDNSFDENSNMPLAFQGKPYDNVEDIKRLAGCQVRCIASMIDYLVPGTEDVNPIANARVPIVRYIDTNIHNSVDLSVNNSDSFHITEYMYTMGLMDHRIRPFIFMVRQWYKEFEMDRYIGRENFTNFQLSYMCLSFLQQLNEPLIPTFEEVMHQIGNNEIENEANLLAKPFIFNFNHIHFETNNTSSVLELFTQFLEYVESFDFSKHMVTVRTMKKLAKPEPETEIVQKQSQKPRPPPALFMENIFDSTNPWGGNVSDPECSTLKIMSQKTLQALNKNFHDGHDWGLLKLLSKLKTI